MRCLTGVARESPRAVGRFGHRLIHSMKAPNGSEDAAEVARKRQPVTFFVRRAKAAQHACVRKIARDAVK